MNSNRPCFARGIGPHVDAELAAAWCAMRAGDPKRSFHHLERAHVLGQPSTRQHVRVHVHMLIWGVRTMSAREVLGQLMRIVGAATKTPFGLVPRGNTGGANISPFRPLPVPDELEARIAEAKGPRSPRT